MSDQTLSAVARHVVDQYSSAGKHLNQAYRTGAERLVDGTSARYASFLQNRSIPLVNEQIKSDLIKAQQVLAGFLLKGVYAGSDRTAQAIDRASTRATSGIEAIASTAARIEAAFDLKALETVRALNMPAATLAAQVAEKIAQGAQAVESRVATVSEEEIGAALVVAKPARRAARKA